MPAPADVLLLGRGGGEARVGEQDRLVGELRHTSGAHKRLRARGRSAAAGADADERVDRPLAVAHIEMQMREAGIAGQPDQRERLPGHDPVALA